jgi:WS/DGAT/MGAT family acyltransferase
MTSEVALHPLDAAFLQIESERTPMHMGSIGIFKGDALYDEDGRLRIDDIRRLIASRLSLVPKLRQVVSTGLLGEAPPVWIDDPNFNVCAHVRACQLPAPGSDVELRALCGEMLAVPLDRSRPMWDLMFVEGLAKHKVAVIERLHHSMADGLAAAELATVLLDLSPSPQEVDDDRAWVPEPPLPVWRAAMNDLLRLGRVWVRTTAWGARSLTHPITQFRQVAQLGRAIGTLVTPKIVAPTSSLTTPISASRAVDFVRLSLGEVREVGDAFGTTINDVLLTVVAGGLHRLLEGRGELTEASELQALVPVGLTNPSGGLANTVSALFVRLPIGERDPVRVLERVAQEVSADKRRHQALAASAFLHLLDPLPQSILGALAGVVQHQPFFNVIVTNVPGPPVPLYALGARLLEAFPIVPLAGNQSMSIAALSYDGQLNLGVLSDPVTCPDASVFCQAVQSCFGVLTERAREAPGSPTHLVGVPPPSKETR